MKSQDKIRLNDGTHIPIIAFGTWTAGGGSIVTERVDQALDVGFNHIDTAQLYRNEEETGVAIRESGLSRDEIYVTTKYSGFKDIETSIQDSLKNLGLSYVDLYLIHSPRLAQGDIPALWKKMEKIKADGLAKSIGVSNFQVDDLKILLKHAKVVPAVNQIQFHPYVYQQQRAVHAFGNEQGIITEAYSALIPITRRPGGPLDAPLNKIAERLNATPDQVLLAWVKAKGAVTVTYSSKKDRLEGYLKAMELELTSEDINELDSAGAKKGTLAVLKRPVLLISLISLTYSALRVFGVRM
ncbi:Aldo/keto reductase [Sistotremastrum niveocremeum HHB9708]|uniref:Aldo/keto reductase n=1 Tax=Sistotremastrum niveocremeum HHB9708 TaxID=1314777 RepID=A0A164SFW5_9AGAM|nr:Aldo/keto reductase [Sistotremastrum niveocremeum HHB9708]